MTDKNLRQLIERYTAISGKPVTVNSVTEAGPCADLKRTVITLGSVPMNGDMAIIRMQGVVRRAKA